MQLLTPLHNCEKTTIRFIRNRKINITNTTIKTALEAHPDYPSLLSISDFLHTYNIENIALKTKVENFSEFTVPFIAHVINPLSREKVFVLVHEVKRNSIIYEHTDKGRLITEDINAFKQRFTGHALLIDSSEAIAEKEYSKKRKAEKENNTVGTIALLIIPALVLVHIISLLAAQPFNTIIFPVLFLLSSFAGVAISFLLILFEIDHHNPLVKDICQAGRKVNCAAVLQSKASGMMGIGWSSIGFCYFTGMLLAQLLLYHNNPGIMSLLAFIGLAALPYTFFSVYYQWRVVKQWCLLCLAVQVVIAIQFLIALTGGLYDFSFSLMPLPVYMALLSCFMLPALVLYIAIPTLKKAKEGRTHYNTLQQFKHNGQVFDAILSRQKKVVPSAEGLGITIGNPDAKWKLIKVCNPYCGPCARAHPAIEELVDSNTNVQVQIIFTATGEEGDIKTQPVQHLLAIAAGENKKATRQALDDWYNAAQKDYGAFAAKHPMPDELLTQQKNKILTMKKWCDDMEIQFTPTFFVNGYQLPEIYNVAELKYFLTE